MGNAGDYLSKPLLSLFEGRYEGVVKSISFDKKLRTAEWLVIYDENDAECEEKAVAFGDLFAVGENAVIIKSGQALVPLHSASVQQNNPLGAGIFTADGRLLGSVEDVLLDKKNVLSLVYDKDKTVSAAQIVSGGRDVVIIAEEAAKVKALKPPQKRVPRPKPKDKVRVVSALLGENDAGDNMLGVAVPIENARKAPAAAPVKTQAVIIPQPQVKPARHIYYDERENFNLTRGGVSDGSGAIYESGSRIEVWPHDMSHVPERIIASYGFLLGRTVTGDILNSHREVIIQNGTVIDAATVEKARRYGRLVELTKQSN